MKVRGEKHERQTWLKLDSIWWDFWHLKPPVASLQASEGAAPLNMFSPLPPRAYENPDRDTCVYT